MYSYRRLLTEATKRTAEWGLECRNSTTMQTILAAPPISSAPKDVAQTIALWFEAWSRQFPMPPRDRANSCAPIHLGLAQQIMLMDLMPAPTITIGDVIWDGDACFQVTPETLRAQLDAGHRPAHEDIRIHAWLTFPDMTIVDATLMPWICKQQHEVMDLNETMALMMVGNADMLARHYAYRPLLVGPEFLWRTGTVAPMAKGLFEAVETDWLQHKGLM